MKRLFVCLCASLFAGLSLSAENLLKESFRTVDLVTTPEKVGKMNMKFILCGIPKGTKALKFSCDVKVDGVVRGKEKWFDARIMSNYTDNKGKKLAGGPTLGKWKGTKDWRRYEKTFNLKVSSDCIALMPCLFNVKAGELHIKNMCLEPAEGTGEKPKTPEEIAAEQAKKGEARRQEAAAIDAAAPKLGENGTIAVSPDWRTQPIKVVGNRLQEVASGKDVWLQGVAVPSMEWGPGERIPEAVRVAVEEWHANVIRLPVRSTRWFGQETGQTPADAERYRRLVDYVVGYLSAKGCYLVLDLHEYRAAKDRHVSFWKDAATRYRNVPAVIFGLLNEPHGISWEVWRNGGMLSDKRRKSDVPDENDEKLVAEMSVGMQALVNAVRSTGAKNLVTAGGLDWAYDISGAINGFALDDPSVIYETHVYPWKGNWEKKFLATAEKYPVLLGEVGASDKKMPFESKLKDPHKWSKKVLACIQKNHLNWTGWSFHPGASPCLLKKGGGFEPTEYWGVYAKDALAGRQFSSEE